MIKMWRSIEAEEHVPPLGTLESNWLDFKGEPTTDAVEMAKDVAALANANGGTILIGAFGKSRVQHYQPLSADDAKRVIADFDTSIRDRCSPTLLHSAAQIPYAGGFLVAINVEPAPGSLVGVRLLRADPNGWDGRLCFFPIRVGTHTKFLAPEQIAMFIDGRLRRIAVSLYAAVGEKVVLHDPNPPDPRSFFIESAILVAVEPIENAVTFGIPNDGPDAKVTLPIDVVETMCRVDGCWHVYLKGRLEAMESWDERAEAHIKSIQYIFKPSR